MKTAIRVAFVVACFVILFSNQAAAIGPGALIIAYTSSCTGHCSCTFANSFVCSAEATCSIDECASCSCTNAGCTAGCVSQQGESDPDWITLEDHPIYYYEVEELSLEGFLKQIKSSGWQTESTATTPDPITETYTDEYTFEELVEAVIDDFDLCVAIDEITRTVSVRDCS